MVTPHVGVWIETVLAISRAYLECVTPHVGVWIETNPTAFKSRKTDRHTSCRCVD